MRSMTDTDKAIALRKERNAAIKATKNPSAKFESCTSADEKRRRCRDLMRALHKSRPRAARATSAKNAARYQCCKACIAARASELLRQKET